VSTFVFGFAIDTTLIPCAIGMVNAATYPHPT
jgi:hypothetical protein